MKYFEKSALEAVLFVSGDPLPLVKLSEAVGQNLEETERLLLELQTALEENQRGIRLAEVHGGWQLVSAPNSELKLRASVSPSVLGYHQP